MGFRTFGSGGHLGGPSLAEDARSTIYSARILGLTVTSICDLMSPRSRLSSAAGWEVWLHEAVFGLTSFSELLPNAVFRHVLTAILEHFPITLHRKPAGAKKVGAFLWQDAADGVSWTHRPFAPRPCKIANSCASRKPAVSPLTPRSWTCSQLVFLGGRITPELAVSKIFESFSSHSKR